MPRRAKGPRLWFRPGRATHGGAWFILDGPRQRGTGLGAGASAAEKDAALKAYLTEKHTEHATTGARDPARILIDDVLALYVRDKAGGHARPESVVSRVQFLRQFWGGRTLDQVTGTTCREYVEQRSTPNAARRELEDLRAAINHHRREGLHDRLVSVKLPDKPEPRERWLTRKEAAALIRCAWRYTEPTGWRSTDPHTRRHVARFMVVARYMGSRAAVICSASIEPHRPAGRAWVDLTTGMFHGRPAGQRETKKRRQLVRVPPPLLAHLRRWRARGQRYVVEWHGEPVKRIDRAHASVVREAGFGPDVHAHVWRHTVATWLMQAGTPPWQAAGWLAMSVQTLLRVYGHHSPDHADAVHGALSRKRAA